MASAALSPKSVELFYSYAHCDEKLCKELQKHLTALKRAGLIRDWYDRKIDPGSVWATEIQNAMERAGLILLMISADFLASKYIFDVELPFALERHKSGLAKVIPVLLRPVEWRDLAFAKLQVLPSDARPITAWPDPDQAFSDVAARLRELIYGQRLSQVATPFRPVTDTSVLQERVLDAAIASSIVMAEPTDLVTMFRTAASEGLRAILSLDRSYSAASDDVKSNHVEVDFPLDPAGKPLPGTLRIALASPDFDPPSQEKQVRVPAVDDSDVFVFMLTPKRTGKLRVVLQVFKGDLVIASRLLVTASTSAAEAEPVASYGVVSISLAGRVLSPLAPAPPHMPPPPSAPQIPYRSVPRPRAHSPASAVHPGAVRSSRGNRWLFGAGSLVAGIALISSVSYLQRPKADISEVAAPPTKSNQKASQPTAISPVPRPLPKEPIPVEQDGQVAATQIASSLRQLRERTNAAEKLLTLSRTQLNKGGPEMDPKLSVIEERIHTNLRNADSALRAQEPARAAIFMREAQKDLSILEQRIK